MARSTSLAAALLAVPFLLAAGASSTAGAVVRGHRAPNAIGTGPVILSAQPGTPLDAVARTLASRDIADSASHGQQALVLIGSAPLSAHRGASAALFVQLQSAPLCGSAGCETSVYLDHGGTWRKVLDSVSGPITVLRSEHGRMHDLLVGKSDRWVWAGTAYRDTLAAPALAGLRRSVERHQRAVARGAAPPPE